MAVELRPEALRRTVDPASLDIDTTESLEPLAGIIGQGRAVSALSFGLGIREPGFNVFVAGPPGMGKMTAVQGFIEAMSHDQPTPPDWCYVNNFADPYQPLALRLPAGKGRELQQDMKSLVEHIRRELPRAFEAEEYGARRDELMRELERERHHTLGQLGQKAQTRGFGIQVTPSGIGTVPLREGDKPMSEEDFAGLSSDEKDKLRQNHEALQGDIRATLKRMREVERAAQGKLDALNQQVALYVVGGLIEDLIEKYAALAEVGGYLAAVRNDILENVVTFIKPAQQGEGEEQKIVAPWLQELPFRRYAVNVLVDNGGQAGPPVIVELNPAYNELFGKIEKESLYGAVYTDFTMIKPGALHRANGGYLVLQVEDVLREALCWDAFKRALRAREARIEDVTERLGFGASKSLRPQPVPLDFKVVLIGHRMYYSLLLSYDSEFGELFKVRADFDTRMDHTPDNAGSFLAFLSTVCRKQGFRHLDGTAAARLLEYAIRLAEDQTKISTHFGAITDAVREANYWAGQDGAATITGDHVQRALDQKVLRANLIQERLQEMISRGMLLIDTRGAIAGQINGLSVLNLGDFAFGQPSRITCTVEAGRAGIIDIEREVAMGGPIHSKGVLILSGYLAGKYGRRKTVTVSARLVFEQNYEGVEGDSASSAELYALLSALADLPITQSIAVTGSINQHGQVQVIGGVNEKVEGFFDVCRALGLTGQQGVIIPAGNVSNLMLREDVVDAVRRGEFHVWSVADVDEGIALLTGAPAADVHARVTARLREIDESLQDRGGGKPARRWPVTYHR